MPNDRELAESPLSPEEQSLFRKCEKHVQEGLAQFIAVGRALLTIRDQRLYRAEYRTFGEYCDVRWQFSERRINQFVEAAQAYDDIAESEPMVPRYPLPSNERQTRPLVALPKSQRASAWLEAVEANGGKAPSGSQVQVVASRYLNGVHPNHPDAVKSSRMVVSIREPMNTPIQSVVIVEPAGRTAFGFRESDDVDALADELAKAFHGDQWRRLLGRLVELNFEKDDDT